MFLMPDKSVLAYRIPSVVQSLLNRMRTPLVSWASDHTGLRTIVSSRLGRRKRSGEFSANHGAPSTSKAGSGNAIQRTASPAGRARGNKTISNHTDNQPEFRMDLHPSSSAMISLPPERVTTEEKLTLDAREVDGGWREWKSSWDIFPVLFKRGWLNAPEFSTPAPARLF